jgi:hypothetical protein
MANAKEPPSRKPWRKRIAAPLAAVMLAGSLGAARSTTAKTRNAPQPAPITYSVEVAPRSFSASASDSTKRNEELGVFSESIENAPIADPAKLVMEDASYRRIVVDALRGASPLPEPLTAQRYLYGGLPPPASIWFMTHLNGSSRFDPSSAATWTVQKPLLSGKASEIADKIGDAIIDVNAKVARKMMPGSAIADRFAKGEDLVPGHKTTLEDVLRGSTFWSVDSSEEQRAADNLFYANNLRDLEKKLDHIRQHPERHNQRARDFVRAVDVIKKLPAEKENLKALLVNGYVNSMQTYDGAKAARGETTTLAQWNGSLDETLETGLGVCQNQMLTKKLMGVAVGIPPAKLAVCTIDCASPDKTEIVSGKKWNYAVQKNRDSYHAVLIYDNQYVMNNQNFVQSGISTADLRDRLRLFVANAEMQNATAYLRNTSRNILIEREMGTGTPIAPDRQEFLNQAFFTTLSDGKVIMLYDPARTAALSGEKNMNNDWSPLTLADAQKGLNKHRIVTGTTEAGIAIGLMEASKATLEPVKHGVPEFEADYAPPTVLTDPLVIEIAENAFRNRGLSREEVRAVAEAEQEKKNAGPAAIAEAQKAAEKAAAVSMPSALKIRTPGL